jgi:hypothetical protein
MFLTGKKILHGAGNRYDAVGDLFFLPWVRFRRPAFYSRSAFAYAITAGFVSAFS